MQFDRDWRIIEMAGMRYRSKNSPGLQGGSAFPVHFKSWLPTITIGPYYKRSLSEVFPKLPFEEKPFGCFHNNALQLVVDNPIGADEPWEVPLIACIVLTRVFSTAVSCASRKTDSYWI